MQTILSRSASKAFVGQTAPRRSVALRASGSDSAIFDPKGDGCEYSPGQPAQLQLLLLLFQCRAGHVQHVASHSFCSSGARLALSSNLSSLMLSPQLTWSCDGTFGNAKGLRSAHLAATSSHAAKRSFTSPYHMHSKHPSPCRTQN